MKCVICNGELLNLDNENTVSAISTYDQNFITGTYSNKYVCTECGYIQEYAKNPKVFTDKKYRNMELDERSNIKKF